MSVRSNYTVVYDRQLGRVTRVMRKNYASPLIAIAAFFANTIGIDSFLYYPCEDAQGGPAVYFLCFIILMFLVGIPLMGLETAIGQFRHAGQ